MTGNLNTVQQQAFEACTQDVVSFMLLFEKARRHPKSALLFHGMVAPASMYVIESYKCLTTLFPELRNVLSSDHADLLRASRHRAKLLDGAEKSIEEVTGELAAIAEQQRRYFLEPHRGFLGPLKRAIQPDMGLSTYDDHIFSTTHSTIFGFGEGCDFEASAFTFGEAMGSYTAVLLNLFRLEMPSPLTSAVLPGTIEMKDIKYEALYKRGPFGASRMEFAAGLALLLATLNYMRYILHGLLPAGSHTQFRLKFIAAFHANSNINAIQNRLAATASLSADMQDLFRDVLGNADSRWLRKRGPLRDILTHYLPDPQVAARLASCATRVDAIEHLSGDLTYDEIDALLDRHIAHMSDILEAGFRLSGDPFWLGRVS